MVAPASTVVVPLTISRQPGPVTEPAVTANRHVVAGRKGAERVHQLIQRGKLYEQEHDLKRGRQRLRQLIEEGKLYEQEHGLSPSRRRKRGAPVSPQQAVRRLLDTLVRVAKPAYRASHRSRDCKTPTVLQTAEARYVNAKRLLATVLSLCPVANFRSRSARLPANQGRRPPRC